MLKAHKEAYWSKGICPQCKTRPLESGKKKCNDCLRRNNEYQKKWKEKQLKEV